MAVFIRAKRVSDPLDERVKARLLSADTNHQPLMTGYASSGSEHAADPSCLSSQLMIHAFFELDEPVQNHPTSSNEAPTDEDGDSDHRSAGHAAEELQHLLYRSQKSDPFLLRVHSDVVAAAEALVGLGSSGFGYRRAVMARLREVGYNAGICKAKWQSSGGLTAGSYEYIDIVVNDKDRYIVDLDFSTQFVVARATAEYEELVESLPRVMVGRAEEVKQVVRMVEEAARRSLKNREMSVPPWRKRRYMLAKWLGPYRRTVNPLPSSAGAGVNDGRGESIKCRAVGFRAEAPERVVNHLTRTR